MNHLIELKFYKSKNWTKEKILYYLNLKKFIYEQINETYNYYIVIISETI